MTTEQWLNVIAAYVGQAVEDAVAEECEACAKIAESYDKGDALQRGSDGWSIAADIRARRRPSSS